MSKGGRRKTLSEKVAKLIAGVYLEQMDAARMHMLPEPVVLDGIVLRARGHALGLQAGEGESTHIVFVNSDMHVSHCRHLKTNGGAEGMDEVHNGEEVFTGGAQSNIFIHYGGNGNFSLQLGLP